MSVRYKVKLKDGETENVVIVRWPGRVHKVIDKLNDDPGQFCVIQDVQCTPVNLVTREDVNKALPRLPQGSCTTLEDAKPWLPGAIEESKDEAGKIVLTQGNPGHEGQKTESKSKGGRGEKASTVKTCAAEVDLSKIMDIQGGNVASGDPLTGPGKILCILCHEVNVVPEFDIEHPPDCAGMNKAEHKDKSSKIATCWTEER